MSQLKVTSTPIEGLKIVERIHLGDARGFFSRLFCAHELLTAGWTKPISQINRTYTAEAGTIRGLHYQVPPHAEMKLVTCIKGEVWDVAVDLRNDSPTYLEHFGLQLSEENKRALLIPEGFAHGFQSTIDDVELLYCHSEPYTPAAEAGICPTDSKLAIDWPKDIARLSDRDAALPHINEAFEGIQL